MSDAKAEQISIASRLLQAAVWADDYQKLMTEAADEIGWLRREASMWRKRAVGLQEEVEKLTKKGDNREKVAPK